MAHPQVENPSSALIIDMFMLNVEFRPAASTLTVIIFHMTEDGHEIIDMRLKRLNQNMVVKASDDMFKRVNGLRGVVSNIIFDLIREQKLVWNSELDSWDATRRWL